MRFTSRGSGRSSQTVLENPPCASAREQEKDQFEILKSLACWSTIRYCYRTVPGPERVCLGPAGGMGVLDFAQERFRNMIPGDFESKFLTAGDSETKEGLRVEEVIGEPRLCSALAT